MRKAKLALSVAAAVVGLPAMAQGYHYVNPYITQNGTLVQGHMQTNPNGTRSDNWSTRGNVNPFTGQAGTRDPLPMPSPQIRPIQPLQPLQPLQGLPRNGF